MSFYVQHAYGKSDKLERLTQLDAVRGVVLSPKDEDPGTLRATADAIRARGKTVIVDPQAYFYSTDPTGKAPRHQQHGLPTDQIRRSTSVRRISDRINAVAHMNESLGDVEFVISPAPLQMSLSDANSSLALQYASTAAESWGSDRTIATVAVDQRALDDSKGINDWLDELTSLRVAGFYLLIDRGEGPYPPAAWPAATLQSLFQVLYVLGELNEYRVIWGYADLPGAIGAALANGSTASGWSYGSRNFNSTKWMYPASGGNPQTIRMVVPGLGAAVRAEDEALDLLESRHASMLWPGEDISGLNTAARSLTRPDAQVAFLERLAVLTADLGGGGSLGDRLERIHAYLDRVQTNYAALSEDGLLAGTRYGQVMANVRRAFEGFRAAEDV